VTRPGESDHGRQHGETSSEKRTPLGLISREHERSARPANGRVATGQSAEVLDRAAGALLGLGAGDALGAGYEFRTPPTGDAAMIGGGLGNWASGEWTDDTQMAICIAKEAATGSLDPVLVGERFLEWFHAHPKDVGAQTGAVLRGAGSGKDLHRIAAEFYNANLRNSAGNGSLMRTAPVALAHLGDDKAIVRSALDISALTHGDPLAGEACVLWCIGIDRAIREGRLDGVRDGLGFLELDAAKRWEPLLDLAETGDPAQFTPNGFVITALQAAYAAVRQTPVPTDEPCLHLQHALHAAVRIGNDTDTVAAIAGALLGARWGASAVPLHWRALMHGWPPGYRDRDLVRLAVLIVGGGKPDASGWPSAPDLGPYYAEEHPVDASVGALHDDPGVIVGNVPGALHTRADVVVSLCRMGAEQFPEGVEHHEIFLIDQPDANPNLRFILRDTAETIASWRDDGRTVFVHCVRGESRTPAVAAAYLALRLGITGAEALQRVTIALPGAQPNGGFMRALEHLPR
jgi:ADP-ribosyl-[dinitrogen reductase] hydrolase